MLQLTRSALVCTDPPEVLAGLRQRFDQIDAVCLPRFLHPDLLDLVARSVRAAEFFDRVDEGLAREQCMQANPVLGLLHLVANDHRVFDLVRQLTGCGPIGSFAGRVYRMGPGAGHHDGWHSDVDGARLIGMSVNLSDGAFAGGCLELRPANAGDASWTVANTGPGDAVLFRIADRLQHRVTDVEGHVARVAFAGWFQSRPVFVDLLKGSTGGPQVAVEG